MLFECQNQTYFDTLVTKNFFSGHEHFLIRLIIIMLILILVCIKYAFSVSCCICLDEIQYQSPAAMLPCGHAFHEKCFRNWVKRSFSCPVCRAEVTTIDKNEGLQARRRWFLICFRILVNAEYFSMPFLFTSYEVATILKSTFNGIRNLEVMALTFWLLVLTAINVIITCLKPIINTSSLPDLDPSILQPFPMTLESQQQEDP